MAFMAKYIYCNELIFGLNCLVNRTIFTVFKALLSEIMFYRS